MTLHSPVFPWLLWQRFCSTHFTSLRRLAQHRPEPGQWLRWSETRLAALGVDAEVLAALGEWRRLGPACAAAQQARCDEEWLAAHGAQLIHIGHPLYPPLLLEIADPPACLHVRGDSACLAAPQLAVVGSRRPSRQGLADAGQFAGALAEAGFTVTSGLAYGIDAAAHRAALAAAGGRSVAVLGSGLDVIYPPRHDGLAEAVAGAGALVSELPLGSPPRALHFPRRNRIISGLSLGVLVVEAALRSGSLVTARLALEQNREVFALPGSIHNPSSRGCNELIRRGATLVRDVADILAELHGWSGSCPAPAADAAPLLSETEAAVLAAVGYQPTALDCIAEGAALPVAAVLAALSELELRGLVENRAGAYQRSAG